MFHRKKKEPRTCEKGHVLEASWERCPFCAAEENENTDAAARGSAVIVPTKKAQVRRLAGWIVAISGEQEGQDFRIVTGRNLIGKGAEADIVVKDPYLSERHALLEVPEADGVFDYLLTDLDSKCGTELNGKKITQRCRISDGDRMRFGNTEFKFRSFS